MRRWLMTVGVACAMSGPAAAQFTTYTPGPNPLSGIMPGQVVGNTAVGSTVTLNPVGNSIPRATSPAGNPIGNPLMRPYDPAKPLDVFKGTNIDPKSVIAPVSGFSNVGTAQPDLLDKLYDKLGSITRFFRPTYTKPPPSYTPGIYRRDRERAAKRMWRPD